MQYNKNNLINEIEEILLKFASLYDEVTTSDLQGIATVETKKIIELITKFNFNDFHNSMVNLKEILKTKQVV